MALLAAVLLLLCGGLVWRAKARARQAQAERHLFHALDLAGVAGSRLPEVQEALA